MINACDAGREGELIFREIVQFLGSAKPVRRLWLQSMTRNSIRTGFESLEPGEAVSTDSARPRRCRSQSDWLIGMNATRALTRRLARRARRSAAWSAGRVQTPTLALVVDRELEILAHVPRPYWRIEATSRPRSRVLIRRSGSTRASGRATRTTRDSRDDRIFDEARARAIVAAIEGRTARRARRASRAARPPPRCST